jgi:glycosyltransferase involved in cell wall biosynthesis
MKNLIIFIPSIEKAGVEKNLFILSNYFSKHIKDVYLVTANSNYKKNFNKKIKIICPKTKFFNNQSRLIKTICCFFLILNFIKGKEYVLFSFQQNLFAAIISKIFSLNLIIRLNTSPNKYINKNYQKIIFRTIYKSADEIIVNSKDFKKDLKKKLKIKSNYIYNPIITNDKFKKKIKRTNKELKILNIGRLTDQKDHMTLLRSLKLLKESNIKFTASIIGGGYKYNVLKKYIKTHHLQKEIKLLGYKKNAHKFMNKANLFISSSKYEGLPNVLIEAQKYNLPIISSNCPSGPKEILMNGKLGELFPVSDYKKLFYEIKKFYIKQKYLIRKSNLSQKYLYRFNAKENCFRYLKIVKKYI